MDKNHFIKILQHYPDSSVEEAQEVLTLKQQYPFSQLLHALSARVSKDHDFGNQQAELQGAAVYAADRMVLKEIMTISSSSPIGPAQVNFKKSAASKAADAKIKTPITTDNTTGDLAEEVIHDLNRLHDLKHNFEMLFVDVPETFLKKAPVKPTFKKPEAVSAQSPIKSKKERIIELAKAVDAQAIESNQKKTTPKSKARKHPVNHLIEEIKSTKKKIDPEGEKQKEQLEIIEQFIKAQPSITNSKDKPIPAPQGDLSTIKSGEFGDNIVSETLVEILVKQGKKDKAIEVLKKLIWKFPQKKAYFAAQIEELKK